MTMGCATGGGRRGGGGGGQANVVDISPTGLEGRGKEWSEGLSDKSSEICRCSLHDRILCLVYRSGTMALETGVGLLFARGGTQSRSRGGEEAAREKGGGLAGEIDAEMELLEFGGGGLRCDSLTGCESRELATRPKQRF